MMAAGTQDLSDFWIQIMHSNFICDFIMMAVALALIPSITLVTL